jgi:Protein of unknown function (DUF4012)
MTSDPNLSLPSDATSEPIAREHPHRQRVRRRRRVPFYRRRKTLVLVGTMAVVAILVAAGTVRYWGVAHDGSGLRDSMNRLATDIKGIGPDFAQTDLNRLTTDLDETEARLRGVRDTVASDPLIALLRVVPWTSDQIHGVDHLMAGATDLSVAGDHVVNLARNFLKVREAPVPSDGSRMGSLVAFVNSSRPEVIEMAKAVKAARAELDAMPQGLVSQLSDARTLILRELDRVQPSLDAYLRVQDQLPAMLGMNGPRRYLVLAEDPAEIRPSGGLVGTYGLLTLDQGSITECKFKNIKVLDYQPGLPYVAPPIALKDHLLGSKYSWQLADAGWSPDFPTAAQKALDLYTLESGDSRIDGIIALDTYSIDFALGVTGPIEVPEYGVTVKPGQATMTLLANTRQPMDPSTDRKAILDAFGAKLLSAIMATPAQKWTKLLSALTNAVVQRHLMVWATDQDQEALIAWAGWDGSVRQDPGDYVQAVDANVAPTSKYNLVTPRTQDLQVQIDRAGDAHDTLALSWDNRANLPEAASLRKLPITGTDGILGNYLQVLTPAQSKLQAVSGHGLTQVNGVEAITAEAGRRAFGIFLLEPPGTSWAKVSWISPNVVETDGTALIYRLTVQKQDGRIAERLHVSVTLPAGAKVLGVSPGMVVKGGVATLDLTAATDVQVWVRYTLS